MCTCISVLYDKIHLILLPLYCKFVLSTVRNVLVLLLEQEVLFVDLSSPELVFLFCFCIFVSLRFLELALIFSPPPSFPPPLQFPPRPSSLPVQRSQFSGEADRDAEQSRQRRVAGHFTDWPHTEGVRIHSNHKGH